MVLQVWKAHGYAEFTADELRCGVMRSGAEPARRLRGALLQVAAQHPRHLLLKRVRSLLEEGGAALSHSALVAQLVGDTLSCPISMETLRDPVITQSGMCCALLCVAAVS